MTPFERRHGTRCSARSRSLASLGRRTTGAAAPAPPTSPREAAPIDLTGQWVAIVNEEWRWRMVTPPKGDYASVPLNDEGRRVADQWDPSQDGACEAYGAAALLRMPTRLRIRWQGDDATRRRDRRGPTNPHTRLRRAGAGRRALAARAIDGEMGDPAAAGRRPGPRGRRRRRPARRGGYLEVKTTNLSAGWLRRNGVPYSEDAAVTEYFARFAAPNGDEWLMVTTIVDDPRYLTQRYITSSHFRREAEGGKLESARVRSCGHERAQARVVALLACAAASAHAQPPDRSRLTAWHVRDGIYMIVGAGGNTTVQVGDDGVLVVDTKLAAASDVLLDAIRQDLRQTDPLHHQHALACRSRRQQLELIAKAGSTIAGGNVSGAIADAGEGAAVIAHENVLVRMSSQDDAAAVRGVADGHVVHAAEGHVLQRRGRADPASAGRAHGRRQHRVLPPLGRHQHGRRVHDDGLPRDPTRGRRRHRRRHRRAEPHHRAHRAAGETGRRHARDPGPRPALRRSGRRRVPRHGHDHPRPHQKHGRHGNDAAASASGEADGRLRWALRRHERLLDDGAVRRSGLRKPQER